MLLAGLSEGAGPFSSPAEDLGFAFQKGQPFLASSPFAPVGSHRRAEKGTCDFADVWMLSGT